METKTVQAIADHLGLSPQDLDKGVLLRDDLGLGPVELTDLLNDLSVKFDITFDSEDISGLQTLEDLLVLVEDNSL